MDRWKRVSGPQRGERRAPTERRKDLVAAFGGDERSAADRTRWRSERRSSRGDSGETVSPRDSFSPLAEVSTPLRQNQVLFMVGRAQEESRKATRMSPGQFLAWVGRHIDEFAAPGGSTEDPQPGGADENDCHMRPLAATVIGIDRLPGTGGHAS